MKELPTELSYSAIEAHRRVETSFTVLCFALVEPATQQVDTRSLFTGQPGKAEPITPEVKRRPGRPNKFPVPDEVPEGLDAQIDGFTVFIFVFLCTKWRWHWSPELTFGAN